MALRKRETERQADVLLLAAQLPRSPGHVFYRKLNRLLAEAGFDPWVEKRGEPNYAGGRGRPGIPPGTYFRMLLVGYFEGHNLGVLMRRLFQMGTPRGLQAFADLAEALQLAIQTLILGWTSLTGLCATLSPIHPPSSAAI
jgi:hypothetical protein